MTNEQWLRLAATRRSIDLAGTPARASINAIEIELASIERAERATQRTSARQRAS
jgi:hypothetical protein